MTGGSGGYRWWDDFRDEAKRRLGLMWTDLVDLPIAREEHLREVGARRAAAISRVRAIDAPTAERIRPVVMDTARVLSVRSGWATVVGDFLMKHGPLLFMSTAAAVTLSIPLWITRVPWPTTYTAAATAFVLVMLASLLIVVLEYLAGLLAPRRGGSLCLVGLFTASLGAVLSRRRWLPAYRHRLDEWSSSRGKWKGHTLADLCLPEASVWALTVVTGLLGLVLLVVVIKVALVVATPRQPRDALQCAVMLHTFIEIALVLDALHQPSSGGSPLSSFVTTAERHELMARLEGLARTAEGPWRRALRTGDAQADQELARVAFGIAARVRAWKNVVVLGGGRLDDMRQAFALGVVNAADGEWLLMTSDELTHREVLGQRLSRWARTGITLVLLVGGMVAVSTNVFGFSSGPAAATVVPVASLLAMYLANAVDPRATERFGAVQRLQAETVKK